MKFTGLTQEEAKRSREAHGANTLTQLPPDPLWKKLLRGFRDPMIRILLVALTVQLLLFFLGQAEWFEAAGVFLAIAIANGVSAVSERRQEGMAGALRAEADARQTAKLIRGGILTEQHVSQVVVGDIVFLQAGDRIPADGYLADGALKVDQAALNGETEEADKRPAAPDEELDLRDLLNPGCVYRGTVVRAGEGYMEVAQVGDKTRFGQLALEGRESTPATPLQRRLEKLAKQIAFFGCVGAVCIVLAVLAGTLLSGQTPQGGYAWVRLVLDAVAVAVTILVCAAPEGLPMLSFQSLKMDKAQVLVRKREGLETVGSLNILFCDMTGTITEGRLSVVELATGNVKGFRNLSDMPGVLSMDVVAGIGVNNSATASAGTIIGGNRTDRALLGYLLQDNAAVRLSREDVLAFEPFDSNKKTSSVTIRRDGVSTTYIKGAPEKLLPRCTRYINEKGEVKALVERNYLTSYLDTQAGRSMRLLAVAKAAGDRDEGELTLICIISIRDAVRAKAAEAVAEARGAGIQVVMVTGDRKETAAAIAREAGLLSDPEDVALTSGEMAELSDGELLETLPRLRVVSRALPADKSRLVRLAQERNLVVGMTGDGVNDAPALKKADVGFAMGSGAEAVREAGDITVLDDSFSSIARAILYGRTMFQNIRKFLIFQLTVNVAAVLICFLGPLLGENVVLTVLQLLLVNLAMDTLAAMAFGGEPPEREYLRAKPIPRDAGLVSREMLIQVLVGAAYISFICLGILFLPFLRDLFGDVDRTCLKSAVFATFMMAITFNGFNARTASRNLLRGLGDNRSFLPVMLGIFAMQFLFVTFGGPALQMEALSLRSWLICLGLAVLIIPVDLLRKTLMQRAATAARRP